jgi:hypothetical protein
VKTPLVAGEGESEMSNVETKDTEAGKVKVKNTRLWFDRWQLRSLPERFRAVVAGTPFEGSRLVYTGGHLKRYRNDRCEFRPARYEFAVIPTVGTYEPIPGYRFVGYVQTDNGGTNYVLHRLDPEFEFTKEVADSISPERCDECGVRHRRVRQLVLVEKKTGDLHVVGGACAKKFRGVNLDNELRKALVFTKFVGKALDEGGARLGCGGSWSPPLSLGIAISEVIADRFGYVSYAESLRKDVSSTAGWLSTYYQEKRARCSDDPDWDRVHKVVDDAAEKIWRRASELADTGFKSLLDYANAELEKKWSEFFNNVIAWLSGKDEIKSWGITAYLGSIKGRVERNITRDREQGARGSLPCKGFNGAPVDKVADWGEFKVVSVKLKEGHYGYSYGFLCVRETEVATEKVWFKVGEGSEAIRAWKDTVGEADLLPPYIVVFVTLRGKLTEIKGDISFGKNVKFKKVRTEEKNSDTRSAA